MSGMRMTECRWGIGGHPRVPQSFTVLATVAVLHKDDMFPWWLPVGAPMYYLDLIIPSPADRGVSVEPFHHGCLSPASRGLS